MILFTVRVVSALHGTRQNVVDDWIDGLGSRRMVVRNELGVKLSYLREQPRDGWEMPFYRASLKGYREIGEIRFKCHDTQIRVFGFFGPSGGDYTLLGGATHKMNRYNPTDAILSADELRKKVINGTRYTEEFKVTVASQASR